MNTLAIYDILKDASIYNKIDVEISGFKIDTRKVNKGDCYIAIKGEHNDGNKF